MAQDINVVVVTGRLTADPQFRQIASGQYVMKFGLANNKRKKKQGDQWIDQPPNFFNVTVWGRQAEVLKPYLQKGKQVAVNGRLQQSTYQVQGEAHKRTSIDIVADNIQLLGSGGSSGGAGRSGGGQEPVSQPPAGDVPPEFTGGPDEGAASGGSDPFDAAAAPAEPAPDDEIPF
jgi:single-strand DNA-binding protein